MAESGTNMDVVYLSGGGARSDLWSRMVASALGLPIKRLSVDEGPSFGAAVLALVGTGSFTDAAEAADATLTVRDEILPDGDLALVYEDAYERFTRLYPAAREEFRKAGP